MATAMGGFPQPILHGLCSYGVTARALLRAVCDSDASRFGSMHARFSAPVLPGQKFVVNICKNDPGAWFRTLSEAGVVLDRGWFLTA